MNFKHKHKIALILTPKREKKHLKTRIMYIFQSMKVGNAKKKTELSK